MSRITDQVLGEVAEWRSWPLDSVYAAVFMDAVQVKMRDGQVANRPIYAAIGVTLEGRRDVLGLWAGQGGEGAKFWMHVLVDMKNRGLGDVFFVVCDGLKGLPEVVGNVWPAAIVQTCVVHVLRNTFPARVEARLGCVEEGCETDLYGTESGRGRGRVG